MADGVNAGATVGIVNDDPDAAELFARLVETTGRPATRLLDLEAVVDEVTSSSGYAALIIDSLHCGIEAAMIILESLREAPDAEVASTPVLIVAASDANRLYAFQAGADAFLLRPFHSDELLAELEVVLARSAAEREQFRQQQLLAG